MRKKLPFKRWLMAGAIALLGASSAFAQAVPPNFTFDCRITVASQCSFLNSAYTAGGGIVVDKKSRVWYAHYANAILVRNPDGSKYNLSSDKLTYVSSSDKSQITHIDGVAVAGVRGLGLAHDGNLLAILNSNTLYKLDVVTGEPLAMWTGPTGVSFSKPTSTADGQVLLASVSGNTFYILKESTTTPGTYDVLVDGQALPNRSGTSRAATISPDGNAIYVTYENTTMHRNIKDENGNWVSGGTVTLPASTEISYPLPDHRVFTVSYGTGTGPAKLKLTDFNVPGNSYEVSMTEIPSASLKIRGLAFTPGLDTMYMYSEASGKMFRYFLNGPMNYYISDVRNTDANGLEINAGDNVRLKGVVNTTNISGGAYNFFLAAKGDGAIHVFSADQGSMTYVPTLGDSIAVMGKLAQNKGMLRVVPDSIRLIAAGQPLATAKVVTALDESVEGQKVTLQNVTLVDPAQWTTGTGDAGFGVQVQQGTETFMVYIPSSSPLYNMAAPSGPLQIDGFVVQSKEESPFTSGYFIMPQTVQDLKYVAPGTLSDTEWCVGETVSLPVYAMGNGTTSTVTVELSDASGSFANATVIGTFTGQGNGDAQVTVPQVANGTGYKVRLVMDDPALTNVLSQTFSINTPVATLTQEGNVLTAEEGDTYTWYRNGVLIADANTRTYTATQTGRYHVVVGNTGECTAVSGILAVTIVGEILPTYKRDCLEKDPTTGECIKYFGDDFGFKAADFQALAVDKQSKLWIALYGTGLAVRKPDGSKYTGLTSSNITTSTEDASLITEIRFKGFTDAAAKIRSVGTAHDGNILVIVGDRILYKLDAITGEPLARWKHETITLALAGVSSTADGRILLHTVLGADNTHFILKQSTTNPGTFDVIQDAFALPNRIGYASRSNSISPDGNTILVSGESTTINVNERDANGNWVAGENITTVTNGKKAYAVDNNNVIALTEPVGAPAALNYYSRANATSPWMLNWTMHLEGMTAADADLRGLAFTPNLDTVYVGSYATGAVYRFIAQTPTDYTIAQVRPVDAQGVAEKAGEYVRLNGTVNTANLSANGYNFIMIENGAGIQVYKDTKGGMTYNPSVGDNIEAIGTLVQNKGMLRLVVDHIHLVSAGGTVTVPTVVTTLTEANEALPVRIEQATLADPAQWTTGVGQDGFAVQVQKGTETINVFIPSTSPLYNMAAPAGELEIDGVVFQSKEDAPFTSGYYVVTRAAADVKFASVGTLSDIAWCAGESFSLPIYAMGANPAAATVKVELSDALGAFTTPQVIGTYQGAGTGQVNITLPDVATGAGYKVRLVLESPELTNMLSQTITITNAPDADFTQNGHDLTATEGDAYQWYKDGTAIPAPAGTARTFFASENGSYKVEVKTNDCASVSAEKAVVVTAIRKDAMAQAVKLYPVPTTGELFLSLPESVRNVTHVHVTDLAGKTVLSAQVKGSETLSMDLSQQASGVYLVVLETPEGKIVRRVVKQ